MIDSNLAFCWNRTRNCLHNRCTPGKRRYNSYPSRVTKTPKEQARSRALVFRSAWDDAISLLRSRKTSQVWIVALYMSLNIFGWISHGINMQISVSIPSCTLSSATTIWGTGQLQNCRVNLLLRLHQMRAMTTYFCISAISTRRRYILKWTKCAFNTAILATESHTILFRFLRPTFVTANLNRSLLLSNSIPNATLTGFSISSPSRAEDFRIDWCYVWPGNLVCFGIESIAWGPKWWLNTFLVEQVKISGWD